MSTKPTAKPSPNLLGLSADDLANIAEFEARVAEVARRERLSVAALWAIEHERACRFDSKGWPVDGDDWPLHPPANATHRTQLAYRIAVRMAKTRRTKRLRAAQAAKASAFDFSQLSLAGVRAAGDGWRTMSERRKGPDAKLDGLW